MIPVYICEDNPVQLNRIREIIENYIFIEEYDMLVVCACTKPKEILEHLKPDMPVGIYFFDIDLNAEIDGLQLAEKIRQYDASGYIIFITSHFDLWRMTFEYKVAALDFIDKARREELPNRIVSCLKAAWQQYEKLKYSVRKTIPLRVNGRTLYEDIDEVLYIKAASSHRIRVHSETQSSDVSGNLDELEHSLPGGFFRCHRAYMINLKKVTGFLEGEGTVTLAGQVQCPVATRKKYALKNFTILCRKRENNKKLKIMIF